MVEINTYTVLHGFSEENVEKISGTFLTETIETRCDYKQKKSEILFRYVFDPGSQVGVANNARVLPFQQKLIVLHIRSPAKLLLDKFAQNKRGNHASYTFLAVVRAIV